MVEEPESRFFRKLSCFAPLEVEEAAALQNALGQPSIFSKGVDLVTEGENTSVVHIILDGFACCYKITPEGRRQIFSYLVPGDFCNLHTALLKRSDYSVAAITDCSVVRINRSTILTLTERHPAVARALWWNALVEGSILQEWITGIGRRSADGRIAHLFCELHARLKAVGLVSDGDFALPFSQAELADTVGLSTVHLNRSLKQLRAKDLVTFRGGMVAIPDVHDWRGMSNSTPAICICMRAISRDKCLLW